MTRRPIDRIRAIALALPEVDERVSHGAPCFFVGDRRPICYFHDADFSGDGRVSLWCRAAPDAKDELVATDPGRFFSPTPSASGVFRDWIGVYLDTSDQTEEDWREIAAIVEDSYRLSAPKRLVARLDDRVI